MKRGTILATENWGDTTEMKRYGAVPYERERIILVNVEARLKADPYGLLEVDHKDDNTPICFLKVLRQSYTDTPGFETNIWFHEQVTHQQQVLNIMKMRVSEQCLTNLHTLI